MTTENYLVLRDEVKRYSIQNGYPISDFTPVLCDCKRDELRLFSNDEEGVAVAECPSCKHQIYIRDSREFARELVQNVCSCGYEELLLGVGIATYEDSEDVRWVYVGGQCRKCGLSGVYTDWNER